MDGCGCENLRDDCHTILKVKSHEKRLRSEVFFPF